MQFGKYLTRLCMALEMEPVVVNFGLDEAVMTILARVEEIMKKDVATLSKIKAQNQHLQQKLSRMTDQLESKVKMLLFFKLLATSYLVMSVHLLTA